MSTTVYHGTFSDEPPHEWGEPFHAGSVRATEDRAADQMMAGEVKPPAVRRLHAYTILASAPMSRIMYQDPMSSEGPRVPETSQKRIYPYENIREDRGATSYVIPSDFVGKHVKHLGVQFQGFYGDDEQENALMHAMTTMVGGK